MKTIDQIYHYQMPGQVFGVWQLQCRLRIFQPHPELQTVMITDTGFEIGWFIPYVVEELVEQIVKEFQLDPAKLVWIEHYTNHVKNVTSTAFSQVTFTWQNGRATNPQWIAIALEAASALTSENLLTV